MHPSQSSQTGGPEGTQALPPVPLAALELAVELADAEADDELCEALTAASHVPAPPPSEPPALALEPGQSLHDAPPTPALLVAPSDVKSDPEHAADASSAATQIFRCMSSLPWQKVA